ncbi:MAG: EAL domain-containing protein [Peptostreptococcaceae bacterium]
MSIKIKAKLSDFLYHIYSNSWLKSIRYGLITIQPFILACCIILIIATAQSYVFNNEIEAQFTYFYYKIYSLSRLILLSAISYYLALLRNAKLEEKVNPYIVAVIGLFSSIVITNNFNDVINMQINARWVFYNLIISLLSSEIFIFIYLKINKRLKLLDRGHDNVLMQSINAVLPTMIMISLLFLVNLIYRYTSIDMNFNPQNLHKYISNPYDEKSIFKNIKYLLDVQIYWFLGGHGGDIIDPMIINKSYLNVFCNIGGTGSTICLIIAIFLYKSFRQSKDIAKLAIIPSIFNINEVIVYGLPIILNPIYIIPFIVTPAIMALITNIATIAGLVVIKEIDISWKIPILINAFIATESIKGIILQLINLAVGVMIYIPFVAISYHIYKKDEFTSYESLKKIIFSEEAKPIRFTKRADDIGQVANVLVYNLCESLNKEKDIYLEYQPQVNKVGRVVGVESLFRWKHKDLGNIPPNIAIALAEESGLINNLGKWIIKESIIQLYEWNNKLDCNIEMSINISSKQLEDSTFAEYFKNILDEYKVSARNIKLEITESLALGNDTTTNAQLKALENLGIKLAIDDFGVGYNPILYIKKYKISTIKIDGSLIKDIDTNEESRNIVKAMYGLCECSKIEIVSEFVENNNQKRILDAMGEGIYQGYLFSKPLSGDECLEFILKSK